ncbi:MAG TPA: tail fiber domain-containing protein [Methyloceanibacter sp.]|nr:tail fiber domain-containing protein [Methyloceanibacter sp.]
MSELLDFLIGIFNGGIALKWCWLAFEGGGSETTVTTNIPPKTETELAVDALTLRQLQRQEDLEKQYGPVIQQYLEDLKAEREARISTGITPEQRALADKESFERSQRMAAVEEELTNLQLEQIKSGGRPTEEQIASINAATGAAQKAGEADIERFRTDTLRQINEEVASASGLRPTDTPIVRLSERAGEESARQQGILTSKLAETNAMARLNFPLASAKLTSDIATGQQSLALAGQQFQQQLTQRAQDNRFRLFAANPTNQFSINPSSFSASLAQERLGARTTTTSVDKDFGLSDLGSLAGGIGGLMRGAALFSGSDRRLKRDIYRIGELPSGIPVYIFRFLGFEDWHVGCMADEVMGVIPEAVAEHESGYQMVAYGLLH